MKDTGISFALFFLALEVIRVDLPYLLRGDSYHYQNIPQIKMPLSHPLHATMKYLKHEQAFQLQQQGNIPFQGAFQVNLSSKKAAPSTGL